jgi:hypothetical protein
MYQISRAIYRELAPHIIGTRPGEPRPGEPTGAHPSDTSPRAQVLRACESTVERLATDRHYFARPARTLFCDIRGYFPMNAQARVYQVVACYIGYAQQYLAEHPYLGYEVTGKPLQCRATTRKGTACQRMPLPRNGYCPSHQHLAETEDGDQLAA